MAAAVVESGAAGAARHADAVRAADGWFQLAFGRGWGRRLGFRLLTELDDAESVAGM